MKRPIEKGEVRKPSSTRVGSDSLTLQSLLRLESKATRSHVTSDQSHTHSTVSVGRGARPGSEEVAFQRRELGGWLSKYRGKAGDPASAAGTASRPLREGPSQPHNGPRSLSWATIGAPQLLVTAAEMTGGGGARIASLPALGALAAGRRPGRDRAAQLRLLHSQLARGACTTTHTV